MSTNILYPITVEKVEGCYNASIPSLDAALFHAYGETACEARESLQEIFADLERWYIENIGPMPPPTFADANSEAQNEARDTESRASVYYMAGSLWTQVHTTKFLVGRGRRMSCSVHFLYERRGGTSAAELLSRQL